MTSNVKELRDSFWRSSHGGNFHELEGLISAAHAEGVAEGAEQEREKILVAAVAERERIIVSAVYMKQVDSIMADCYIVPASVLAPTKESEK